MMTRGAGPVFHTVLMRGRLTMPAPTVTSSPARAASGMSSTMRRKEQHDDQAEQTGKDIGPARLGATASHQGRARHRAAHGDAAAQADGHVGDALPPKVARGVGVLAVGVGHALADAGGLHQGDEGNGQGRQDQGGHQRQVGQMRKGDGARDLGGVAHQGHRLQSQHGHQDCDQSQGNDVGIAGGRRALDQNDGDDGHQADQ